MGPIFEVEILKKIVQFWGRLLLLAFSAAAIRRIRGGSLGHTIVGHSLPDSNHSGRSELRSGGHCTTRRRLI